MSFLMSEILPTIRTLTQNELEDLGSTDELQNTAIFEFVNVVLRKRARQAYQTAFTDTLDITADGYQTFLVDAVEMSDLYEPLMLYDVSTPANPRQTTRRTSYDGPSGWYRASESEDIHTKGLTGDHQLHYIRYPAVIDAEGDTVEFPRAGQWDLIMDVVSLCKLPKNYYQEMDAIKKYGTGTATVKASIDARGSVERLPSMTDREE